MQASVAKFGRPLDGLVCSAGVFEPTPIADWNSPYQGKTGTEAEFQRVIDINVMGTILAVKAALTEFSEVGGSMVIITSTAGQRGSAIYSAYSASKGAQLMFMRSMAQELAPRRIRVNCVAPGWTETDMAKNNPDFSEHTDEIAESIPMGECLYSYSKLLEVPGVSLSLSLCVCVCLSLSLSLSLSYSASCSCMRTARCLLICSLLLPCMAYADCWLPRTGRPGLPEDVGAACSFLLSDLSPFITGSTITVGQPR